MSEIITMLVGNIGSADKRTESHCGHMGQRAMDTLIAMSLAAVWYAGVAPGFPEARGPTRPRALLRNFRPLMPGPP
ncbi:MAG: hypothetical protein E6R08_04485 [Nevskiaceae bacterium]|jgi:hypothetical protein|nr:MAG: hypothetical protein EKK33_06050 [Bradyrhizobiaceae bacterium]TXG98486.1 MAG: hypothetical protein E6R08_04485 [Nevskiaceae bacterium]